MLVSPLGASGASARVLQPQEFDDAAQATVLTELDRLVGCPALNLGSIAERAWLILGADSRLRVIEVSYSPTAEEFVTSLARGDLALSKTWRELGEGYYAGRDAFERDFAQVRAAGRPGTSGAGFSHLLIVGSPMPNIAAAARMAAGTGERFAAMKLVALGDWRSASFALESLSGAEQPARPIAPVSVKLPTPTGIARPYGLSADDADELEADDFQPLYRELAGDTPSPEPATSSESRPSELDSLLSDAPMPADKPAPGGSDPAPHSPTSLLVGGQVAWTSAEPADSHQSSAGACEPPNVVAPAPSEAITELMSAPPALPTPPPMAPAGPASNPPGQSAPSRHSTVALAPAAPRPAASSGTAAAPAPASLGGTSAHMDRFLPVTAPAQPAVAPPLARLAQAMGGNQQIVWNWRQRGERFEAMLRADGHIQVADGTLFADPVEAAEAVSGHLADGWRVWRIGPQQRTLADALAEVYRAK